MHSWQRIHVIFQTNLPGKTQCAKPMQQLFEGFINKQNLNTSRAPVVVCSTDNFTAVVPYYSETENMADSNPLGITEYEPFMTQWNPQRSSSSLYVSLSCPAQPLRNTGCPCVTLKASALPLRHPVWSASLSASTLLGCVPPAGFCAAWYKSASLMYVFSASDHSIPYRSGPQ